MAGVIFLRWETILAGHGKSPDLRSVPVMVSKRFKTNTRLWLAVSLALFIPPWFIGHIDKDGEMAAAGLWALLFSHPINLGAVVGGIVACVVCFGIPALALGWIIQCLIVMVIDLIGGKKRNATNS